jgi:hypothetical protein
VKLPDPPGVPSGERIYLDREDDRVEQLYMPQMQTSWGLLYRAMKDALPAQHLHSGETFVGFRAEGDKVVALFENGAAKKPIFLSAQMASARRCAAGCYPR